MAITNDLAGSATFGVSTATIGGDTFILEDIDISESSESYVQKDGNGEVTGQVIVSQHKSGSATAQLRSNTLPSVGDIMTFDSDTYILTEVGDTRSNDSERKVSISFVEEKNP